MPEVAEKKLAHHARLLPLSLAQLLRYLQRWCFPMPIECPEAVIPYVDEVGRELAGRPRGGRFGARALALQHFDARCAVDDLADSGL